MSNIAPTHHAATGDPIDNSTSSGTSNEHSNQMTSSEGMGYSDNSDMRRGSGSEEPLSLTAASERIDQDSAPISEHRGSLPQNAPGRAGSIGEAALGALGYGGSTVERPKEDQGLGEKIVSLLGA